MREREVVIKSLELCNSTMSCLDCAYCTPDRKQLPCTVQMLNDAIKLLKRDTAEASGDQTSEAGICPACRYSLLREFRFCPNCGAAIRQDQEASP